MAKQKTSPIKHKFATDVEDTKGAARRQTTRRIVMKKFFTLLLTLALMMSLGATAFATATVEEANVPTGEIGRAHV